ncbi:MAG TPA: tetratricopeptide repeat protein, partial [Phycisphaerales bacterium]|nr:tetratricopeptide repeat protein [Phycisphaerales bacterium]
FQKAISLQPNNARNLFIDGMALAEEGWDAERDRNMQSAAAFYNAAVASYQRALALEPKNAEGQMNLGKAWLRLRQPQHAIASLREAIRINDRYVAARNELATALAASGDLAAAQIEFRNVLAIDPNDETAGRGLALIQQLQERAKP